MGPIGEEFDLKKHWLRIPEDAKIANAKVIGGFTKKAKIADSYWTLYMKGKDGRKAPILRATLRDIWGDKLSTAVAKELGLSQYTNKSIWTNKEIAEAVLAKTNSQHYFNLVSKDLKNEGFSAVAYSMTGHEGFIARAKNGGKVVKAQMIEGAPESIAPEGSPAVGGAPEEGLDGGIGEALDAEVDNTAGEADVTVDLLKQKQQEQAQTDLVEKTAPEETAGVFMQLQDAEKMIDEAKEEMEVAAKKIATRPLPQPRRSS